MAKNHRENKECIHTAGCGCTPTLFVNMMEKAGRELSRRQFIKGAGVAGGMLALGSFLPSCSDTKPVQVGASADAIYHGGPILTLVKDGDRAEALAVKVSSPRLGVQLYADH